METAAQVLGYDQFFIALYDHPKLVHQLLDVITDGMIAYVNAQAKINGPIKRVTVTDHVAGQISAEHFREYGLPYLQRLFQAFPDAITIYHNEADIKHVLPFLPELDFTVYHMGLEVGGDYAEGVALARRTLGNRCLMGNVHESRAPSLGHSGAGLPRKPPAARCWRQRWGHVAFSPGRLCPRNAEGQYPRDDPGSGGLVRIKIEGKSRDHPSVLHGMS